MNTGYLPDFAHPLFQYQLPYLQAALVPNTVRNVHHLKSGQFENLVYQGKFGRNGDYKAQQPKKSTSAASCVSRVEKNLLRPCDFPNNYTVSGSPSSVNKVLNKPELYSRKVFVGGLPIDVREEDVYNTFRMFGKVLVDWPRSQDQAKTKGRRMIGYVFLVFEEEASVQRLVQSCHEHGGRIYLFVTSPMMRDKPVQVRPWKLSDSTYKCAADLPVDSRFTIFIGGVPRPTRACDLAEVLNEKYGMVSFVGVDTDPELNYPKGCARITFADAKSYIAALNGRFIYLSHVELEKRVEIKPYIVEDQMCDECGGNQCHGRYAPYFCGHESCLQYYCESCWDTIHKGNMSSHCPLIRLGDQTKVFERAPHHGNNNRRRSYARG